MCVQMYQNNIYIYQTYIIYIHTYTPQKLWCAESFHFGCLGNLELYSCPLAKSLSFSCSSGNPDPTPKKSKSRFVWLYSGSSPSIICRSSNIPGHIIIIHSPQIRLLLGDHLQFTQMPFKQHIYYLLVNIQKTMENHHVQWVNQL